MEFLLVFFSLIIQSHMSTIVAHDIAAPNDAYDKQCPIKLQHKTHAQEMEIQIDHIWLKCVCKIYIISIYRYKNWLMSSKLWRRQTCFIFFLCASSRCASGWFRNIRHRTRSSHLVIVAVAAAANDPFYCSEFNLSNFKQLVHDWAIHSQWTHTNTFLFEEREHSSASSKPQIGCLVDRNMRKCDKVCVRARILSSINMSTVFFCFCLFKCCGQCWPDFHIDYEYAIVNDWK